MTSKAKQIIEELDEFKVDSAASKKLGKELKPKLDGKWEVAVAPGVYRKWVGGIVEFELGQFDQIEMKLVNFENTKLPRRMLAQDTEISIGLPGDGDDKLDSNMEVMVKGKNLVIKDSHGEKEWKFVKK